MKENFWPMQVADTTPEIVAAEIKQLSPPPLLSTEDPKIYDRILTELVRCFKPQDMMEKLLVAQMAIWSWEIFRYGRHKTAVVDRRFRRRLEFQARRRKQIEENKQKFRERSEVKKDEKGTTEKQRTELDRYCELDDVVDTAISEVDDILLRVPEERDHQLALEQGIKYHLDLDYLLNAAVQRRNDVIEQFARYRQDLSRAILKDLQGELGRQNQKLGSSDDPRLLP